MTGPPLERASVLNRDFQVNSKSFMGGLAVEFRQSMEIKRGRPMPVWLAICESDAPAASTRRLSTLFRGRTPASTPTVIATLMSLGPQSRGAAHLAPRYRLRRNVVTSLRRAPNAPTAASTGTPSAEETMPHQLGTRGNDREQHQLPKRLRCNFIAHVSSDVHAEHDW